MADKKNFWLSFKNAFRLMSSIEDRLRRIEANISILLRDAEFIRGRLSTYVGNGRAITYLSDGAPIFVNSNDFGPPANFIVGGAYEQDNLDVLMSFVEDDTVFLDVGANLGFFSLRIGAHLKNAGRVHAFEPNPELASLFRGSVYVNGLGGLDGSGHPIAVHHIALGNCNEQVNFHYPHNHLGGGSRSNQDSSQTGVISAPMKKLDSLFGENFTFDLAKIDVEGGELDVIKGMRKSLLNSPHAKVLFEKLGVSRGYETQIEEEFSVFDFSIYSVLPGADLRIVEPGKLVSSEGYFLACRSSEIGEELKRSFFKIYPRQLFVPAQANARIEEGRLHAVAASNVMVFHGPYWHLRQGSYRVDVDATINGSIQFVIAQRFGYVQESFVIKDGALSFYFVAELDLLNFECIAYANSSKAAMELRSIKFTRLG